MTVPTIDPCSREDALAEGAQALANRVQKNLKHLGRWARREQLSCFRIYDRDIPEYAVAIDRYDDWLHVQEYQAPKGVSEDKAARRLAHVLAVLPEVTGVESARIVLKQRRRQKGEAQYERQRRTNHRFEVSEGPVKLWVNLEDYLDTGLFLDHRPVRFWLGENCRDKQVLNLFCYTGVASLHAAMGGAQSVTSVDLSNTYLQWARDNFILNKLRGKQWRFFQEDCTEWLKRNVRTEYDVIFLDPPTFSNSKSMDGTLDIQRDHASLIRHAMNHLADDGVLIFSNNQRSFKLDVDALRGLDIKDRTAWSIPPDFERNRQIHQCWFIRWPQGAK